MKRKFYALKYKSDFALNDSDEKIHDWSTAIVHAFRSAAERDDFCDGDYLAMPISAQRAYKIGIKVDHTDGY